MNEYQPRSRHQQPLSRRERVDRACDEFERQWRAKKAPRIEDFLEQAEEGDREHLLRELIALEMGFRDEAGQHVDPQEYHGRFAGDGQIVDSAFESFLKKETRSQQLQERVNKSLPNSSNRDKDIPQAIGPNGRYAIIRILGRGGFAIVYLAQDTQLDREVALKVPRLDRFDSEAALDFFVEEARKAAQLEHPGIVRVHDVQREPSQVYIVQQYIAGGDLARHVKKDRLSPRRTAELMIAIAEAVGYSHQQRYTHLDLKPANILLDQDGNPHVADFGLALHESVQRDMEGELLGTYVYMSPEQTRGEVHRLDGRSDIWSLGVIFYELLTGNRPFHGNTRTQLFDEIQHRDPRPPRQVDQTLPRELSRICLACLSKRATDRYQATADLIDDLRHWLEDKPLAKPSSKPDAESDVPADKPAPHVVPQGLRSFEAEHADFYLDLLPGPRDREGLPERVRFWKTQIEKTDPDETFTVGLMYGPSGCGKSSLVKAGLIPRLSNDVLPIYVEATAGDTEVRLIKALRKRCPELPADADLPELIDWLRRQGGSRGRKVVIVLDQFEQWLHAHESRDDSQLIPALRHCDGGGVQCLVMVRDDFWMSATRFMQSLEIPLLEGHNSAPVDLFDRKHANEVLTIFGRAYGQLSELPAEPSEEQARFLQHAVDGLADEDKVICVRLAVFAEMMKGRPWTEESLREVGGTEGIGVTFLEETFSAKTAPPSHRLHQTAVRKVLKDLLPEQGSDIKGQMKSYDELLEVSGYAERRSEFDELLNILNIEVRLITPTEPDQLTEDGAAAAGKHVRYYQLTHDFLVPSLRDWLTRKQKETRRGRAELRLAERSALWNAKPENSRLPSLFAYLNMRSLTDSNKWTEPQRKMMGKAGRSHGVRWGTALLVALVIGISIQQIVYSSRQNNLRERTETAVAAMSTARGILVPRAIDDLRDFPRTMVLTELREQFQAADVTRKLPLVYALAHFDDVRVDFLVSQIENASPSESTNFLAAFAKSNAEAVSALEAAARTAEREKKWRYKARLAMLALQLEAHSLAQEMCQLRPDPIQRTLFIEECSTWHGDLSKLAQLVNDSDDGPLSSAVALTVGSVPGADLTVSDKREWETTLSNWYQNNPDAGTHSAAGWAFRQWKVGLPKIAASKMPAKGMEWYVNGVDMTLLKIPAGSFVRKDSRAADAIEQTVTLTRSFLLGDREVTRAQFQQFMDDPKCPDTEKPPNWEGANVTYSPSQQHPVQEVSWYDAVLFCNWLSRKEGLTPCYERTGEKDRDRQGKPTPYDAWRLIPEANGYRLPTEAEWEYACRAGTVTTFSHGDEESLLDRYAVYRSSRTEIPGSKLPNGWGLFDVHGNVFERCHDWYGSFGSEAAVTDPLAAQGASRVLRGGSFYNDADDARAAYRVNNYPDARHVNIGFRVARTYP